MKGVRRTRTVGDNQGKGDFHESRGKSREVRKFFLWYIYNVIIVENILSPSQFYYLRQEPTRKNNAVRNITLYLNSSYSNTTKTLPRALTYVTRID